MLESFIGNPAAEFKIDRIDEAAWRRLAETMSYIQGDLTKPDLYEEIRDALDEAEKAHGLAATSSSTSLSPTGSSARWWINSARRG